ncbi:MAG: M23 family metallopeptidase [bacterium]|nr:M23 family metallopeptidase [bacterium]
MDWHPPINLVLVPSDDSMSFQAMKPGETALPLPPHPGAFGVERAHHVHEGIDLYCAEGTEVQAVEAGKIVAIIPFTGLRANSDWWHDTDAVLVEGASGVVLYGEISSAGKQVGDTVQRGEILGQVKQVLKTDKGRPMSMLHLECHTAGTRDAYEWTVASGRPPSLLDPTPFLKAAKP